MKQPSVRAPSRSRGAPDSSSNPIINSHRTTPSTRNFLTQNPPPLTLNASASSRTTTSKNALTPLISTEFLKKSIFERLEDGLLSGRVPRSINNLGLPQQSVMITDRVISIGDNDPLKLQPTRSKMKKKTAQSLERIKKGSIVFDDLGMRGGETERGNENNELDAELEREKQKEKERELRYTRLMMFIPKNLETLSVAHQNKPSFISFNDIAKSAKTSNPGMLEELVTKRSTIKRSESKSKERGTSKESNEQLDMVKNILKFNQLQKLQFNEQMQDEAERRLTPLKGVAKHRKTKNKLSIRVVPSRRLHEPMYDMMEGNTEEPTSRTNSPDKMADQMNTEPSQKEMSLLKAMSIGIRASSPEDYAVFSMGTYNFKFFWYAQNKEKGNWKPDAREGHTLTSVGKLLVLYGGLGNRLLDRIAVYDSETDRWTQPEIKGEPPRAGRHSHSACEYKGQVVFFGGELKFNATLGMRECMNDIYVYSPEKNEWRFIKAIGKIDPRRNHAATIYDKFMYVYGGIGAAGEYMKDIWAFNFKANQWAQLFPSGGKDGAIAFHTMCACFNEKKDREKYKVAEEGIYVFGGKDEEGKILNTLKILVSSGKNFEWKYPAVKGLTPAARYNHVMLWYRPLQLLLIHGGRNEYLDQGAGVSMNDIRILHLESMTWSNSSAMGYVPKIGRSNHGAALMKTTLLIFGGVTFCEYANPDLRQVEINQLTTRRLMKQFEGPMEGADTNPSPIRTRRHVEILEGDEGRDTPRSNREPDFKSWQPLPLKQQFPIEENLSRFRKAIKQTVFMNIQKKLGN